jgi:DNA-directed RNA polymerase omega subunit
MVEIMVNESVSVEECLDIIPNRFELAMIVMGRARDILLGAPCEVPVSKFTKKSVNKAIYEIKNNQLDIAAIKKKIKRDIITNNLFSKNVRDFLDEDTNESDEVAISDLSFKDDDDNFGTAELDSDASQNIDSDLDEEMMDDSLEGNDS